MSSSSWKLVWSIVTYATSVQIFWLFFYWFQQLTQTAFSLLIPSIIYPKHNLALSKKFQNWQKMKNTILYYQKNMLLNPLFTGFHEGHIRLCGVASEIAPTRPLQTSLSHHKPPHVRGYIKIKTNHQKLRRELLLEKALKCFLLMSKIFVLNAILRFFQQPM